MYRSAKGGRGGVVWLPLAMPSCVLWALLGDVPCTRKNNRWVFQIEDPRQLEGLLGTGWFTRAWNDLPGLPYAEVPSGELTRDFAQFEYNIKQQRLSWRYHYLIFHRQPQLTCITPHLQHWQMSASEDDGAQDVGQPVTLTVYFEDRCLGPVYVYNGWPVAEIRTAITAL